MRVFSAALFAVIAAGAVEPLMACGEKYLMRSRGTRFQSAAPARPPAAILVYANPGQNLPKALASVSVEPTLRKAGYRPTVVTSADAFDSALGRGGWDLIVLDAAEAQRVGNRVQGTSSPVVLPVMFNATRAELAAAKKQHAHVLKGPLKNQAFLDAIDDVLVFRVSGTARAGG